MIRTFNSSDFRQRFDTETGLHVYWGATPAETPEWCPYGPNILDIEISSGRCRGNCKFCYKDNGLHQQDTKNMTTDEFKSIFSKLNLEVLTQIAFGICDLDTNPDMWDIFAHCRENNIVPNFTCNGIGVTPEIAAKAKQLCGAVAVSIVNKEASYDAIQKFTEAGMTQVNIHFMLSKETYDKALVILEDIKNDPRLKNLNAIVFLQYKPKGSGVGHFHSVSLDQYHDLVEVAFNKGISIGFDSCSAPMFLKTLLRRDEMKKAVFVEPCESGLFSAYINAEGTFYPCSFAEDTGEWTEGISVNEVESFQAVWDHPRTEQWRKQLLSSSQGCKSCAAKSSCRSCNLFKEVTPCRE